MVFLPRLYARQHALRIQTLNMSQIPSVGVEARLTLVVREPIRNPVQSSTAIRTQISTSRYEYVRKSWTFLTMNKYEDLEKPYALRRFRPKYK